MRVMLAIAGKDLLQLLRDKANCFFTFVFPVLVAVFFGSIFRTSGPAGKMDVAVADLAKTPASAAFVQTLKSDGSFAVIDSATLNEAEDLVRKGKADAAVILPEGFTDPARALFSGTPLKLDAITSPTGAAQAGLLVGKLNELAFRQLSSSLGDSGSVKAFADEGKKSLADSPDVSPMQRALLGTLFDTVSGLSAQSTPAADGAGGGSNPMSSWRPVEVSTRELEIKRSGPLNSFEVSFPQGVVWGLMGCVMAFGTSIVTERARGTWARLRIAPISRGEVLLGKALACAIGCLIVLAVLLGTSILLLGVRVQSWPMMAVAVVGITLGFTGLMMLIAGLSRTEGAAQGLARAVMLILAMIGGGSIPTAFMPPLMRTLSGVSPFKWAVEAIEGALWRSYSLPEMLVPVGVLLGVAVIGFAVGVSALSRGDD
ncbi:MAG: ABC transporter permease [Phycisphaerales bacterium]